MWGNIMTDPRAAKEARFAAYRYFFSKDMSVSRWLDPHNEYGGTFSDEEEKYFRQRLAEEKKKYGVQDKLAGRTARIEDFIYDEDEEDVGAKEVEEDTEPGNSEN